MSFSKKLKHFFTSLRTRFWYACFGVFFGASIFLYFMWGSDPNNVAASLWGLASGIYALFVVLIVHWRMKRGDNEYYFPSGLAPVFYTLGLAGVLAGLAAMVVYLVVAAENHEVRGMNTTSSASASVLHFEPE
eukprot:TRINITY_DN662_c0_g1_i2.p1 TRINITY_DN662_c0_g1~~TRINITY_DN662_c0_g1_i2.p1  ORF type:complete len:133 (+),score=12.46 TRINITY_DN662_c0_g1_i2:146-544(+)